MKLFKQLTQYLESLPKDFLNISTQRQQLLDELSNYIKTKSIDSNPINLNFICTHNSRRSHIAQLWAQAIAVYYEIENVNCFSGGNEISAFNTNAIRALLNAGFLINPQKNGNNPVYQTKLGLAMPEIESFSKKYDDEKNPKSDFSAIMVCGHADENCPVVLGADKRISLPFVDPQKFDGSPQMQAQYDKTCKLIAVELSYAFYNASAK